MGFYNESIVHIGDDYDTGEFPEKFGNAIYVSKLSNEFYYQYRSSFSIKYVAEGSTLYRANAKTYNLKSGQALIVNDGADVVCERTKSKRNPQPDSGMSIFVDHEVISDVAAELAGSHDIREYDYNKKPIPLFYDDIIRDDSLFKKFINSLFAGYYSRRQDEIPLALYYEIARQLLHFQFRFFEKVKDIDKVKYSTRKEIFSRACVAKEYLESTFKDKFNLDILAQECAMSKYFLIKSFKSVFKKTPQQYHIDLRIRKAKEMLRRNATAKDIALDLGYADIHCFSKQFKSVTGVSPLRFRHGV